MNRSSFVLVEGELARPGAAPLSGIPFGREWTGTPGPRSRKNGVAKLITSCIDITAPHRSCGWKPLHEPTPAAAAPPAAKPKAVERRRIALRRPVIRPTRKPPRAAFAACWTLGAVAVIGWLVTTHAPAPVGTSIRSAGSSLVVARHAASPPDAPSARDLQRSEPQASTHLAAKQPEAVPADRPATAGSPIAAPARSEQPAQRIATTVEAPAPSTVARRSVPADTAASSRTRRAAAAPQAAPPRIAILATSHPRRADAAPIATTDVPSDDPRALIALANALRAEQPASASPARSLADIDWTAGRIHHRLTDAPDAFAQ
jgi:hypothetical protein